MSDTAWAKTARLFRWADSFSGANRKMQQGAEVFITALYERVGDDQIPRSIGWVLQHLNQMPQIRLSFETTPGGWHEVTTNSQNSPWRILDLAHALNGPEGERLMQWLEDNTLEREKATETFAAFTSKVGGVKS